MTLSMLRCKCPSRSGSDVRSIDPAADVIGLQPRVSLAPVSSPAQVTDRGVEELVKSLTSLVTLNVIGCHRLTPRAKCQVARLLDNPFNI